MTQGVARQEFKVSTLVAGMVFAIAVAVVGFTSTASAAGFCGDGTRASRFYACPAE